MTAELIAAMLKAEAAATPSGVRIDGRRQMSKFAERTQVPVAKTRSEIEQTLAKYGATRFAYSSETGLAIIVFEARERRIRFNLPLPTEDNAAGEQKRRQRWRALLLAIKSRLESVESGIESFEEAFLAHVVMPDGETVWNLAAPRIASAYRGESMQPLLPGPAG